MIGLAIGTLGSLSVICLLATSDRVAHWFDTQPLLVKIFGPVNPDEDTKKAPVEATTKASQNHRKNIYDFSLAQKKEAEK